MPLHGDDFQWIQDAVKDGLKGVLFRFAQAAGGNMILAGCEITDNGGGNYDMDEGFVMINYEVCYVPAHSFTTADLPNSSIKLTLTYDAVGQDTFADAVVRDTYEIRRALASAGNGGGNEILLNSPYQLDDRIYEVISEKATNSTSFTAQNGFGLVDLKADRFGNQIIVWGDIAGTYNENQIILLQDWCNVVDIPVGFRPASERVGMLAVDYNGQTYKVHISSSGRISIRKIGGSPTSIVLYLNLAFSV